MASRGPDTRTVAPRRAVRAGIAGLGVLLATLLAAPPSRAQSPDTTRAAGLATAADSAALPSPRGAVLRSLALPGWGQLYVGQPVKTPFVVAAFGGMAGLTVYTQRRYGRLQRAARYIGCIEEPDRTDDTCVGAEAYEDDWVATGSQSFSVTRSRRSSARRNRDLAVLGTAVVYALQALDALVAAELADFDVSEDLSLHMAPTPDGGVAVLTLRF